MMNEEALWERINKQNWITTSYPEAAAMTLGVTLKEIMGAINWAVSQSKVRPVRGSGPSARFERHVEEEEPWTKTANIGRTTCGICGESFEKRTIWAKYCSRKCQLEAAARKAAARERVKAVCEICRGKFSYLRKTAAKTLPVRKYCSQSCRAVKQSASGKLSRGRSCKYVP